MRDDDRKFVAHSDFDQAMIEAKRLAVQHQDHAFRIFKAVTMVAATTKEIPIRVTQLDLNGEIEWVK